MVMYKARNEEGKAIVLYLAHKQHNMLNIFSSLVSLLFTPPLPSNPIYRQLAHGE